MLGFVWTVPPHSKRTGCKNKTVLILAITSFLYRSWHWQKYGCKTLAPDESSFVYVLLLPFFVQTIGLLTLFSSKNINF